MIAVFYLVLQILKLYSYVVIANVIISWLVAFNILNTQNRFVYLVLDFTYRLTDPILNKIMENSFEMGLKKIADAFEKRAIDIYK